MQNDNYYQYLARPTACDEQQGSVKRVSQCTVSHSSRINYIVRYTARAWYYIQYSSHLPTEDMNIHSFSHSTTTSSTLYSLVMRGSIIFTLFL